jgi:hypothetical protein
MKYITITAPGRMKDSIIFLLRPGITTADILKALKLTDLVLFPFLDPARLYDPKYELYDHVENGSRLIAAGLAEASAAYQRCRTYQ